MIFATFYQPSAMDPTKLIEACGDRAVIILDGRNSPATHEALARETCGQRGYKAFQLHNGVTLNRGVTSGPIIQVG